MQFAQNQILQCENCNFTTEVFQFSVGKIKMKYLISGCFNPAQTILVCWTDLRCFIVSEFKIKKHFLKVSLCLMGAVLRALVLPQRPGSLVGLQLPWQNVISHLTKLCGASWESHDCRCIIGDVVWPGTLAHMGEWGHQVLKLHLPQGHAAPQRNANVELTHNETFCHFQIEILENFCSAKIFDISAFHPDLGIKQMSCGTALLFWWALFEVNHMIKSFARLGPK